VKERYLSHVLTTKPCIKVPRQKLKCAILDWNGTIFDDTDAVFSATTDGLSALGYPPPTFRRFRRTSAQDPVTHLHALGVTDTEHCRIFCAEFFGRYKRALAAHPPKVRERFPELLNVFREQGVSTAIVSNHPTEMLLGEVQQFNVEVDIVVGRNEENFSKRKRAQSLLDKLQINADQVTVIGDGMADVALATDLGALCIAVSWGMTSPGRLKKLGIQVVSCPSQIVVD
jgi:phosphoglycolate phosphatase-like HAD superfamily hydrolase